MSSPTEFHAETRGEITLRYFWEFDDTSRNPWEDDEIMAGCVKRSDDPPEPWERILSEETRGYHRENLLFDGRHFIEKAINDGCSREQAAAQLDHCFDRCKSWLNDEWHYVGVTVRAFDEDNEDITPDDVCDSVWGIENDDEPWMIEIGNDIAAEIMASLRPEMKEAA